MGTFNEFTGRNPTHSPETNIFKTIIIFSKCKIKSLGDLETPPEIVS